MRTEQITCDGCGVDLGGICCYSPHQYGDYDTLCGSCLSAMKREAEKSCIPPVDTDHPLRLGDTNG